MAREIGEMSCLIGQKKEGYADRPTRTPSPRVPVKAAVSGDLGGAQQLRLPFPILLPPPPIDFAGAKFEL